MPQAQIIQFTFHFILQNKIIFAAAIPAIGAVIFLARVLKKRRSATQILFEQEAEEIKAQLQKFYSALEMLKKDFIPHSVRKKFINEWGDFYSSLKQKKIPKNHPVKIEADAFKNFYEELDFHFSDFNDDFIKTKASELDGFFSDIDKKSLDGQQRAVVLTDEDATLVLAGAGSGKTLTISAKVNYLCKVKNVLPSEILLISFTKKSAEEMTERIQNRLGIPVCATTFHKLGLDILKTALNYRPEVFDDIDSFAKNFFEKGIVKNPTLVQKLTEYFAYYLDIPTDLQNCQSLGQLYELEKSADLETLKSKYERENFIAQNAEEKTRLKTTLQGEKVKSIEETKIANFLFMRGVNYEYERPYPYECGGIDHKAYRPDFYLSDYDIYLEHFGVSKDFRVPWLSAVEEKKYLDGIKWKRDLHKRHKTKLIETYSYYSNDGSLLTKLEETLLKNGVQFKERDFLEVFEKVYAKQSEKYFSQFINLCRTFILLFKSANKNGQDFDTMIESSRSMFNSFMRDRTILFLEISKSFYEAYENFLLKNNFIDFSDMINKAYEAVCSGVFVPPYKYVIVDEYQDASFSRFNLVKAIVQKSGAHLLCVGDDWQSIYRFAGSDISLFTNFEKYFEEPAILKIEKTYRNSQGLIDQASKFILKNPLQLKKTLRSDKTLDYALVFWKYEGDIVPTLSSVIKKIVSEFGEEKSILLLGRTTYDADPLRKSTLFRPTGKQEDGQFIFAGSPKTPIYFLTAHKAKGLEADNVVILNFKNDRLGFPNKIVDDKILNLVLAQGEPFPFAEERRLFYVAMTRTKNRTFVLVEKEKPSLFFKEFEKSNSVCIVGSEKTETPPVFCPRCKTGILQKQKTGTSRYFVGCSNYPKCDYTVGDTSVLSAPKICPECGGFLLPRKDRYGSPFYGCSNFPYCDFTKSYAD